MKLKEEKKGRRRRKAERLYVKIEVVICEREEKEKRRKRREEKKEREEKRRERKGESNLYTERALYVLLLLKLTGFVRCFWLLLLSLLYPSSALTLEGEKKTVAQLLLPLTLLPSCYLQMVQVVCCITFELGVWQHAVAAGQGSHTHLTHIHTCPACPCVHVLGERDTCGLAVPASSLHSCLYLPRHLGRTPHLPLPTPACPTPPSPPYPLFALFARMHAHTHFTTGQADIDRRHAQACCTMRLPVFGCLAAP